MAHQHGQVSGFITVSTTFPDENSAHKAIRSIVEKRLAACAHCHEIRSTYWWDGAVNEEAEFLVTFKTRLDLCFDIEEAIKKDHPYDTPAITAVDITHIDAKYAAWLIAETNGA